MLTKRELATLLAALQFWKEEITQSGGFTARPYFKAIGMKGTKPLSAAEIDQLSLKLRTMPLTADQ